MITTDARPEEGSILRIGSVAGFVGSLLAMVGNLLHPATPIGDPEGVARTIAHSESWVPVHLVIVVGLILMLGGLVAISRSIEGGLAGALARLGSVAAVAGVTVGMILVIVDGVAAKHLADAWEVAPPEEAAAALRVVLAEEAINFALAALFNILFAGVNYHLSTTYGFENCPTEVPRRDHFGFIEVLDAHFCRQPTEVLRRKRTT